MGVFDQARARAHYRRQIREDRQRLHRYLRKRHLGLPDDFNVKNRLSKISFSNLLRKIHRSSIVHEILIVLPRKFLELLWIGFESLRDLPLWLWDHFAPTSKSNWLMMFIMACFLFLLFCVLFLFLYLSGKPDPEKLKHYQQIHQYRTAVALRDAKGNLIGALRSVKEPPQSDLNHEQREGALYSEEIPPVFWDVLVAGEDREIDFDYQTMAWWDLLLGKPSYKGINFHAMFKRSVESVRDGEEMAGGSGLMNLTIKNLYGTKYFDQKYGKSSRWMRKFAEFQGARHLFPHLSQNDGAIFKRWISMHVALSSAAGDVYGLRAVSATIFGDQPQDLSEAEQAILARAYYRGVRLQPLDSDNNPELSDSRSKRWRKLVDNAKKGVENAYADVDPESYRRISAELERMTAPQMPKVPADLSTFLEDQPFEKRQQYANLIQRTDLFAASIKPLIRKQLKLESEYIKHDEVITDLNITLPVADNYHFKQDLNKRFHKMLRYYPNYFYQKPGLPTSEKGSFVYIVVADQEGRIVRFYRRGYPKRRPIASLSKIPAAVLLASVDDQTTEKYCNRSYKGRRNATGPFPEGVKECNSPNRKGHSFSFVQTLGASKNLPLFYALTQKHSFSQNQLRNLYNSFGLIDSMSLKGDNGAKSEKLAFELSFGIAEATPELTHEMIHVLTQYLYPQSESSTITIPHIVNSVRIVKDSPYDSNARLKTAELQRSRLNLKELEKYLMSEKNKKTLREVLSSATKSKYNGTLSSFSEIDGVTFLLAKSGTSVTESGVDRDKWAIGSFSLNGKWYSFSFLVGTDEKTGLGVQLTHKRVLYPVMEAVVESLR